MEYARSKQETDRAAEIEDCSHSINDGEVKEVKARCEVIARMLCDDVWCGCNDQSRNTYKQNEECGGNRLTGSVERASSAWWCGCCPVGIARLALPGCIARLIERA